MANVIRLKRASGSDPAASDLVSGEPAVRTDTGELFFKKDDGSIAKVAGAGGGPDFKYLALRNAANNGAASFPNADFTLVTSGTTSALTPTAANTLLVSVNGVIQKPNTGTSTPSSGFALSGSTIKFGANISAAPDFILYQESGGIGEPSDETVSEEKLKVSNSPVNGYFLSAQSGNTGGLTWAAPVATSCTGNSATATALATARTINGTSFDGTANITVTAAAGTLTGNTLNSSVVTSSLTSLGDLAGLTVNGDMALTGANYNVLWDKSDNALEFADNAKAIFGTGNDLQIYHNGNHSFIEDAGTGNLFVKTSSFQLENAVGNETLISAVQDGAVELYYDGSKKFETRSGGITVTGGMSATGGLSGDSLFLQDNKKILVGTDSDLQIYHSGNNAFMLNSTGQFIIRGDDLQLRSQSNSSEFYLRAQNNAAVELYYDNSKKFETSSGGVTVTGIVTNDGIRTGDLEQICAGNSCDISIYHDSNGSINGTSGSSYIKCQGVHDNILNIFTSSATGKINLKSNNNAETMLSASGNGAVELYYDNDKKFDTVSGGARIFGYLSMQGSGGHIYLPDSAELKIGNSEDLRIYHNGSHTWINDSGTGSLKVLTNKLELLNAANNEYMAVATENAGVELYYDGTKKFETISSGAKVTSRLGVEIAPSTAVEVGLDAFVATGNDDASDWGADGIFQLTHQGTQATNSEVLLLGAVSGAVGQIACGFGFGRESTSDWGTYISFKTHSTSTANIDELIERWKITSAGHFENNSDSIRIKLGASDDLQIYHDGSTSLIKSSSHPLAYYSNTRHHFLNGDGSESMAVFVADGQCELYHNGSKKFETTSEGATVTTNSTDTTMANTSHLVLRNSDNSGNTFAGIRFEVSSNSVTDHYIVQKKHNSGTGTDLIIGHGSNERVRFLENGTLAIGSSSTVSSENRLTVVNNTTAKVSYFHHNHNSQRSCIDCQNGHATGSQSAIMIEFRRADGGSVGGIFASTSAAQYNTASDYRLKENQVAISDGITRLKTLKPYRFNWKEDKDKIVDGFFAHEVSSVVPEAITGTKDEVDENNDPVYQGIDQSKLVPLLVAALQEAIGRIEALEAK